MAWKRLVHEVFDLKGLLIVKVGEMWWSIRLFVFQIGGGDHKIINFEGQHFSLSIAMCSFQLCIVVLRSGRALLLPGPYHYPYHLWYIAFSMLMVKRQDKIIILINQDPLEFSGLFIFCKSVRPKFINVWFKVFRKVFRVNTWTLYLLSKRSFFF